MLRRLQQRNPRLLATGCRSVASDQENCKEKKRITRDPRFSRVTESHIDAFKQLLGEKNVITGKDALQPYNSDWFNHYHGESSVCVTPQSTEHVAAIMDFCNKQTLAVVPQGGNTGFVGGSVPVFDEVILSLRKMDQIKHVDTMSATLQCQAGCVLEPLDIHLREKYGLMMPIDLGAKGSCHIGGNVATNAGGVRFMRYGSLRANVLGLTVVQADGSVLDLMGEALKKDNTGYDLKQLFIGSEGTLGIITELAMQLPPAPKSIQTMFLGLQSWQHVCDTFMFARQSLGEILSAVEMIDGKALKVCTTVDRTKSPLGDEDYAYYLLLETNGSNAEHDKEKMERFLTEAMEKALVENGTVAQDGKQMKHIWSMREGCAVSPNALGHVRWYDISQPASKMVELVESTRALLKANNMEKRAEVIAFGHLGDGNLHLNVVSTPAYDEAVFDVVDPHIYGYAKERKYSVSAEHGIGIQKRGYLNYSKPESAIAQMRDIKVLYDPKGILNPYKMFR